MIPCYNEERRLDVRNLAALLDRVDLGLVLVDDGSRDGTRRILDRFAAEHPSRVAVLALARNRGKGEAIREGMRAALGGGSALVAYADADFSTPPEEILRLVDRLTASDASAALCSRVRMLGTRIARRPLRHYLGRVFATAASIVLHLPVYDTQCGAKAFRNTPALQRALDTPFLSRWAFDVELLGRLLEPGDGAGLGEEDLLEVPVRTWHDVPASKLTAWQMALSGVDLARIAADLRGRRRVRHRT